MAELTHTSDLVLNAVAQIVNLIPFLLNEAESRIIIGTCGTSVMATVLSLFKDGLWKQMWMGSLTTEQNIQNKPQNKLLTASTGFGQEDVHIWC